MKKSLINVKRVTSIIIMVSLIVCVLPVIHMEKVYASEEPLTIICCDDNGATVSLGWERAENVEYSINGSSWMEYPIKKVISLKSQERVSFKAKNICTALDGGIDMNGDINEDEQGRHMCFEGKVKASGNIMSLMNYSNECLQGCFIGMFEGCTSLIEAPNLPATKLANNCYEDMFSRCMSLKSIPQLVATEMKTSCYMRMFNGCESLTTVPNLPATNLADNCYLAMFARCKNLVTVPDLPATNLAKNCYEGMFMGCESLVTAPNLPAIKLAQGCYYSMFEDCKSLVTAPNLLAVELEIECYMRMFNGCESLVNTPSLPAIKLAQGCYCEMFRVCKSLIKSPDLPATELEGGCYTGMFEYCENLIEAPSLPATKLKPNCYADMFSVCKNLKEAPKLPAKDLATDCYNGMFRLCKSLEEVPELSALELETGCYAAMFLGCTKLKNAPNLPAIKLAQSCYREMFDGCTGLNSAPSLPATKLEKECYKEMFQGCIGLQKPSKLPATKLAVECYNRMYDKCSGLKIYKKPKTGYLAMWSIPKGAQKANYWNECMFSKTGGDFRGEPVIGTVYYIKGGTTETKKEKITKVSLDKSKSIYSGKVMKPKVVVKNNKGKKLEASNYTVHYSGACKDIGKYTVTVTMKGNYIGKIKKTYYIVPKGTSIVKLIKKPKGFIVKIKKQTTKTTGYQIQYATNNRFNLGKVMYITKNKQVSKEVSNLKCKKKYYVRVRTYKKVNKVGNIFSGWSKVKTVITKK